MEPPSGERAPSQSLSDGGNVNVRPMTSFSSQSDAAIVAKFAGIPALLDRDPALISRGHALTCDCLLGPRDHPFHVTIRDGRIVDMTPAPLLMKPWRFSYRASSTAWGEYWQPLPRPGWHDLMALTKRNEAVLEGDIYPFMTHLQFFKDMLALPRQSAPMETA